MLATVATNCIHSDGHRASDWPKEHTWAGKLKISARGRLAVITLLDSRTNQVFATCSVTDDSCVEKTLDSGRYFVLKIQNAQGRHAFIGIAFNERNDSFDFNVALQEHKAECEREDRAQSEPVANSICAPLRDLSLKAGEKITVKLGGATNVSRSRRLIDTVLTETSQPITEDLTLYVTFLAGCQEGKETDGRFASTSWRWR